MSMYQTLPEESLSDVEKVILKCFVIDIEIYILSGERGGSVVECRTPEREVGGSKPTAAVLCP